MKGIQLALQAGKKRKSPHTGFIHLCYEERGGRDTIPIWENALFALALFRSKTQENMLEGRALLERLFAFSVEEQFPIYLHEFPHCKKEDLSQKLYFIFFFLSRDFSSVLGEKLGSKIRSFLEKVQKPRPFLSPQTAGAWAHNLLVAQIEGEDLFSLFPLFWDFSLASFTGKSRQDGLEPEVSFLDLFMGELSGVFSKRALQDSPVHLQAALVYAPSFTLSQEKSLNSSQRIEAFYWGGLAHLHSCVLQTNQCIKQVEESENQVVAILSFSSESSGDEEVAFYLDAHKDVSILINQKKGTLFYVEDQIEVRTPDGTLSLAFSLLEGEAVFVGHILKSNRSSQKRREEKEGIGEAFDWKIALRVLHRKGQSSLRITRRFYASSDTSVGLSTESPIACIPLST